MIDPFVDWLEMLDPVAGPLSALAAILTAIIAVSALHRTAKDSHERTRPMVVPFAQIGPSFIHGALYLVVKNFGATAARNVRITFDPALPEIEQAGNNQPVRDSSAATLRKRHSNPTQVLAPGQNLVNVWTNRAQEYSENEEQESWEKRRKHAVEHGREAPKMPPRVAHPVAPDELTVTVRYEDSARKKWSGLRRVPRDYTETVHLRMSDYDHESRQNPGDGNDVEKRQAKATEAVAWEMWGT